MISLCCMICRDLRRMICNDCDEVGCCGKNGLRHMRENIVNVLGKKWHKM